MVVLAGFASGCTTLTAQREIEMRERAEYENIKASVFRLEERVAGLEAALDDMNVQMVRLRDSVAEQAEAVQGRVGEIEQAQRASSRELAATKQEIVDELSRKVAKLLHSQPQAVSRPVASGYEHVVQTGETLSEIAKAYNVKVSVIVDANKLRDPNAIRVGQKLFIPE